MHDERLDLLEEIGCSVDRSSSTVRMPAKAADKAGDIINRPPQHSLDSDTVNKLYDIVRRLERDG